VVTKPDLEDRVTADLDAPGSVHPGAQFTHVLHIRNRSSHSLNGTQAVFNLPRAVTLINSPDGASTTVSGDHVVVTLGRLPLGRSADVHLLVAVDPGLDSHDSLNASAHVRSSTALPSDSSRVRTEIRRASDGDNDADDNR